VTGRDSLVAAVAPPEAPIRMQLSWRAVQRFRHLVFSDEYTWWADTYGTGRLGGVLWVDPRSEYFTGRSGRWLETIGGGPLPGETGSVVALASEENAGQVVVASVEGEVVAPVPLDLQHRRDLAGTDADQLHPALVGAQLDHRAGDDGRGGEEPSCEGSGSTAPRSPPQLLESQSGARCSQSPQCPFR